MASRDIPFISESRIEKAADLLLAEYGQDRGEVTAPPVPIEDILEVHLRLVLEYDDLRTRLGVDDVLGAILFDTRTVVIDRHLDPTLNPSKLGRNRFTLGHEVGHWRLHRDHFTADPNQMLLLKDYGETAFVCRKSSKATEEWQADRFSSYVLMPRRLVVPAWEHWRGNLDPVCVLDLDVPTMDADRKVNENIALQRFCKPLAERFEVSAEAMRIRLEQLGLLTRARVNTLF